MNMYPNLNRLLLSMAIAVLAGCSSVSDNNFPELAQQSLVQQSEAQQINWNTEQADAVNAVQLTDLMNIPELNALIEEAMQSNPGLQQTLLALKISYAQRTSTASDGIPQLSAGFDASKEEESDSSYAADLTVSWELDLWNKIGDSTNAADKDIAGNIATLQLAKDSLAANIMRAWLQISYQKQLTEIQSMRVSVLENNESIILEQYRSGLGDLEDLDTAKTSTSTARSNLAAYTEELAANQRELMLLIGQLNSETDVNVSSEFPQVLTPLASLPEQDLSRRPDLQSAFFNIEAEGYRTEAAYKALLPSISLSLALSDTATSPTEALFVSPLWSILGQLSAPLFDGGYLRSQAEIADLTTEQTYWVYQETLLNAVNEVEDALGQESSLALQQQHLTQALDSAIRSYQNYQEKYREGLVDISDLINAQTNSFDVKEQLAQVTYNRLTNRIDLGLALGLGVSL